MKILLVNDDGYSKEGIKVLDRALSSAGHEVWVAAPSSNRSAQSHSMSLSGVLEMTSFAPEHYHCSGSPADCILYSLKGGLFPSLPDLVVSGINYGYNCSSDILYSGTCAAACEAVLQGTRGIALSHEADENGRYEFERVCAFFVRNLEKLYSLTGEDSYLNINFPPHFREEVGYASVGRIFYHDIPEIIDEKDGKKLLRLRPGAVKRDLTSQGIRTDIEICMEGRISISVLKVNPQVDMDVRPAVTELCLS